MLLVFFIFSLIAYVILRGFELRRERHGAAGADAAGERSAR